MKKTIFLLLASLFSLSLQAQTKEYIQAFIDKDCYLTGEQILIHVSVFDENQKPMTMSRVAYVELCDMKQMHAQCMVQLENGEGWAKLELPGSMHSGNYQMTVYTRFMRNFGTDSYFRRIVSVVNLLHPSADDDIEFVTLGESKLAPSSPLLTDKAEYSSREKVVFKMPKVVGHSMTLSVYRKDLTPTESFNLGSQAALAKNRPHAVSSDNLAFVPELFGHIVTARPTDGKQLDNSRLALVGKRGKVFDGQIKADNSVLFYTDDLFGSLSVTVNGYTSDDAPSRLEFVSPFATVLPDSLPPLAVYFDESELKDRSVGAQIEKSKRDVTIENLVSYDRNFMGVAPDYYYNLDEWTKFKTVREILIEFVAGIKVRKVNKHKALFTAEAGTNSYSRWSALVLLDGMPVYDIDALLNYDARRLHYVQIYSGRFIFGETVCSGVISFISHKGALQDFLVDEGTQMYTYDFPQNRPALPSPIYPSSASRYPDFRHTLYFNPQVSGDCEFFTSDLTGRYVITLNFVTPSGLPQSLSSEFVVK